MKFIYKNKEIDLPYSFLLYTYDVMDDGENYKSKDRNAEYGMSRADFLNEYEDEAIEDVLKGLKNYDDLSLRIHNWKQYMQHKITDMQELIKFNLPE
jgi:hypothetical protein